MLALRPYQQEAVAAVYRHLRTKDGAPLIVIPTGGGKGLVIAQIATDAVTRWRGRVLILAHVRELLEQNYQKIRQLCPTVPAGLYSAGLGQRCTDAPIVVAGIQSAFRRAAELGPFDIVIVDEAHLLSEDDDTMYGQFLREARQVGKHTRLIGLTASPFRMASGLIYGPGKVFSDVCYEIGIKELIVRGYLCPLISKAGATKFDTQRLHVRGGEFVAEEVETLMDRDALVEAACQEIVTYTADRKAVLIFASGVKHGRHVVRVLQEKQGVECGFVCGATPASERNDLLARFRGHDERQLFSHQPLKYLCNVNVLTTGFDAPNIDCVVLLRPTHSCGLYVQAVGRGFRRHPDKANTLILDFGSNILRHGPVDQVQVKEKGGSSGSDPPAKECPQCHSVIAIAYSRCPDCGYQFPPPERKNQHDSKATQAGILSGQVTETTYQVKQTCYSVHYKRDAAEDAPRTMRVDYRVGFHAYKSEWVCFEHTGYARRKAEQWWKAHSRDAVPVCAEQAVELAENGALAPTKAITVRHVAGEPYERIVDYELGEVPEPIAPEVYETYEEEIPF